MKYAEKYAAKQGDCEALFGIGASMGSYYSSPTALVTEGNVIGYVVTAFSSDNMPKRD